MNEKELDRMVVCDSCGCLFDPSEKEWDYNVWGDPVCYYCLSGRLGSSDPTDMAKEGLPRFDYDDEPYPSDPGYPERPF